MTGKELYESVMSLGRAESLDDVEKVYFEAVNLALAQITRQFPLKRSKRAVITADEGEKYIPIVGEELDEDFLGFCHRPVTADDRGLCPGRDYYLEEGTLYLSEGLRGHPLRFHYDTVARRVTPDTFGEPIECTREALHLLPLLTASIVWASEDESLATRYHSLFRNAQAELLRFRLPTSSSGYELVGGWA